MIESTPSLFFASPRALPKASQVPGRVSVLDIAFAASVGGGVSYEATTLPFIRGLDARLAAWVDHHDHERHRDYVDDPRFVLATKAQHGACPEMVTPELVARAGPVDSIVAHVDLDGLYSAAKWILRGREPYVGADYDARCVDTRTGEPGVHGRLIDRALRARFRDLPLKRSVVMWLVQGLGSGVHRDHIREAAAEFDVRDRGTQQLAERFVRRGRIAVVDVAGRSIVYDKTELLLCGQRKASIAVVRDSGMVTIAAGFESGWDFVQLLGLEGGMPTRVTVPEARLEEVLEVLNAAPEPESSG